MLIYLEPWQAWIVAIMFSICVCWAGYATSKVFEYSERNIRQKRKIKQLMKLNSVMESAKLMNLDDMTREEFEMYLLFKTKNPMEQDRILNEMREEQ